jgi:hypothetical protein
MLVSAATSHSKQSTAKMSARKQFYGDCELIGRQPTLATSSLSSKLRNTSSSFSLVTVEFLSSVQIDHSVSRLDLLICQQHKAVTAYHNGEASGTRVASEPLEGRLDGIGFLLAVNLS